jgi:hypothetical protein
MEEERKKNSFVGEIVDRMLFTLDLILDLILILIFFIGPHIDKYLIFFYMVQILTFFFNMHSLYFGYTLLDLDLLDSYLSFLRDLINNIRDIIYLDFYFVMLVLYSIFNKDVTLFNFLFCFFLLYLYIS